jgi:hypothetical protein
MELMLDQNRKLPGISFPGGYTILYCNYEHEIFCKDCAQEIHDEDENEIKHSFIHWEGPSLLCNECDKELPSEYGEYND